MAVRLRSTAIKTKLAFVVEIVLFLSLNIQLPWIFMFAGRLHWPVSRLLNMVFTRIIFLSLDGQGFPSQDCSE